jgi:hypothetical protein
MITARANRVMDMDIPATNIRITIMGLLIILDIIHTTIVIGTPDIRGPIIPGGGLHFISDFIRIITTMDIITIIHTAGIITIVTGTAAIIGMAAVESMPMGRVT